MNITEIDALKKVDEVLADLIDADAQKRVLRWAVDKFAPQLLTAPSAAPKHVASSTLHPVNADENEIAGIARLTESGELRLTVRDFKARSTNDAAVRIALVAIYAFSKLTGETAASSRLVIKPLLEKWRAYTGNTRLALARHPGIVRDGDRLALDYHAQQEAERYISEILDDSVSGSWQSSTGVQRSRTRPLAAQEQEDAK